MRRAGRQLGVRSGRLSLGGAPRLEPQVAASRSQIPRSLWWYTDAFHVGFRVIRPLKEPTAQEQLRFWDSTAPGVLDVLATGEKQLRVIISTHDTKKKKDESPR